MLSAFALLAAGCSAPRKINVPDVIISVSKSRTFDIQGDVKVVMMLRTSEGIHWKEGRESFGKRRGWSYRNQKVSSLYTHVCESSVHYVKLSTPL